MCFANQRPASVFYFLSNRVTVVRVSFMSEAVWCSDWLRYHTVGCMFVMKWKYSRFIVSIKTISSWFMFWSKSNQTTISDHFILCYMKLFHSTFSLFLSFSSFLFHLNSHSFFLDVYLLPSSLSHLCSPSLSCTFFPLIFIPHFFPFILSLTSHFLFPRHPHILTSCSSSSLFFIIFSCLCVCVCSWEPREWGSTLIARCVLLTHTQTSETQQRLKWQMPQIVIWNTLEGDAGGLWESFFFFFFARKMRSSGLSCSSLSLFPSIFPPLLPHTDAVNNHTHTHTHTHTHRDECPQRVLADSGDECERDTKCEEQMERRESW